MLQVFYPDVAYVSHSVAIVLSGCCICFTHMLQQYVPNISVVSILCCSKWFHIANYKLDVSCVSHTCCKCIFQIFHLFLDVCCIKMFLCCKCFMLLGRGRADWACGALGPRRTRGGGGMLGASGRWCYGRGMSSSATHPGF